jgi:hypothetical protein
MISHYSIVKKGEELQKQHIEEKKMKAHEKNESVQNQILSFREVK